MPLTRICDFMRLFAQLELARKEPGYGQALEAKYCGLLDVIWGTMTDEEQDAVESVLRSDPALPKKSSWKAEHPCTIVKSPSMGCMVGKDICQLCESGVPADLHDVHARKVHQGVEQTVYSEYEHLLDRLPGDAS